MYMHDDTSEGLVRFRDGWSNPLYGGGHYNMLPKFNDGNYMDVFYPVVRDMPTSPLSLTLSTYADCYRAYKKCSPLQSIINKLAEALMNGKWKIENGEEDDVSDSNNKFKKIVRLLRRPNPLQTYNDWLKSISLNYRIYGGTFVYANLPSGYSNIEDATSLWVFSPDEIEIERTELNIYNVSRIDQIIKSYKVTPRNSTIKPFTAKPHEMLFIYDTTENINLLDSHSDGITKCIRIKSLFYEIRNTMQAQEAIYSLNSDRGAQGIITNVSKDAIGFRPMNKDEKERLQNRFRHIYGLMRNQDKIMVTDSSVDYKNIGFNVKDLMLFEGVRENIMHMTDAYNYPFDLLASEKGKTAADKRLSLEALYQDNIIPFSIEIGEKLSAWFGLNDEFKLRIDYSHLNIFQQSMVERYTALRQLLQAEHIAFNDELVTREEVRRDLGRSPKIPEGQTLRSQTDAEYSRNDTRLTLS